MNKQTTTDSDLRDLDLLCFSHLRWDFVFQRPQHLMSRFAKGRRVFFIEEPVVGEAPGIKARICPHTGVHVVVPTLPHSMDSMQSAQMLENLVRQMMATHNVRDFIAWYYTPTALAFTSTLRPVATIYDCMDELSLFQGASPQIVEYEKMLLGRADLVFTGGISLFEAKCEQHPRVHAFPSSVDVAHFAKARHISETPLDQSDIPRPRIGYAGVIDERMDLSLLSSLADMRPEWHLVMLGPVVKIDPGLLPRQPNIHYLGMKPYDQLPAYFAGWDVAMLPFAMNESTRFISPTKTPEYLAAGLPVVSTPVRDVVRSYGEIGLARIGATAEEFCCAVEQSLNRGMSLKWRARADNFLATLSWNDTWSSMNRLIMGVVESRVAKLPVQMAMRAGSRLGAVGV